VQKQFGVSLPLLTFDYLNALGAAFLAGNLLLIFLGAAPLEKYPRKPIFWRKLGVPIAVTLLLLFSAGLVARNAAAVLRVNFHPLEHFGELAAQSLPAGCGVMLSDQPSQLAVFQAALAHHRNGSDWLAVDTRALPAVAYRAGLERRQPAGWLTDETRHELTPLEMFLLLDRIARTNRIFYLNPSYGYFFERFYLVPAGAIYELKIRPNSPEIPALPPAAIAANEDFWTRAWPKELAPLVRVRAVPSGWQNRLACYGLTIAPAHTDPLLANWYSLALDGWGVALQRQGRLPAAQLRWEQALQLNPDNFSARISLACNTNLQAGQTLSLANVGEVADQLGNFQRLSLILNNCGPFDEPVFCYLEGGVFQRAGLLLQAREEMERTRRLAPGVPAPEIALADIDNQLRLPDQARALIRHLHLETKNLPENKALEMELARLEANSWLVQTNSANARTVLQSVLQKNPDDTEIADQVLNSFIAMGDYTNALTLVNVRLARSPDDPASLNLQAAILLQSGQATPAIPILDHLLTLTNLPAARLNRALARLAVKDIAAAEADYQELESAGDESAAAYGLAAIADQRHDTNQAVHYLELCLSNTPPGTLLWHEASKHLAALDHSR
jgi:tetratricopeptide (TPR) repeat protein